MKQTLSMRRQLAINLRYCYSARRAMRNMLASFLWCTSRSSPTIDLCYSGRQLV